MYYDLKYINLLIVTNFIYYYAHHVLIKFVFK